ncbi:hypothetical protein TTHERM_00947630 (macronuclear) [Tetrahymena thermophila SB210]|uniref:Uncharacterized protein n=1 Tax=Tetrahymena thermophila (strain SB210) TaxID=312017 RepID=I7LZE0_TETTS|nr:hypothetical protein TTHERM_00947630 [Tetrahymena thermophila SB210]EAR83336.2 hypothetical protein TTHERM_00947630 [Tetrahymena thermophila SB210]|eukprot:XP_001030999.2 hypothetical protein TTHERM_00947630 [Tetrahymena thermophila SB210]
MIRKILRCLNEAKYGPLPEKVKPKQENSSTKHAFTATVIEFNNSKENQYDEWFNIGDDILINKNFVIDTRKYSVNQFNKMKRVEYVTLNSDSSIINIYFEDYMRYPTVNWKEMVDALKVSQHERLVLLGQKIEEFKSSLREFEQRLQEEYSFEDINNQPQVVEDDKSEEKLVEQRLRKHLQDHPNSGGFYVKRDYVMGKGYIVKSVHITKSLIDMIGWTMEEYLMETALTRQHPECILNMYYMENLVQTLECIKYSFLQQEYTSSQENISILHKSSQIFEARCQALSIPKTGDFIMRIEIPETLSFSDDSATLQLFKKPKQKKFTYQEKQFIEQFYSQVNEDSGDDQEENINKICKYRVISQNPMVSC